MKRSGFKNRGVPLSVTSIFLLKNLATPTRAVALRLSIPHVKA